jgi:hypothetical protein
LLGDWMVRRRGIVGMGLALAGLSTTVLAALGQSEQALAEAEPVAERLQAAGDLSFTEPRSVQLRLLAERGAHEQAPSVDEPVDAACKRGDPIGCALAFAAGARLLLAQGQPRFAEALLVELEQVARIRADPYYTAALPKVVRTTLALDERELAVRVTEGVEPVTPFAEHALAASRAQHAEAAGDRAQAAALYAQAAGRWRAFGNVPECAYALLRQGRCLSTLGKAEAESPLREEGDLFASMGYAPALAETEALLGKSDAAAV